MGDSGSGVLTPAPLMHHSTNGHVPRSLEWEFVQSRATREDRRTHVRAKHGVGSEAAGPATERQPALGFKDMAGL